MPGEPVTVTPLPDSETARKAIDAMPQPVWPGNDHAVVDFADARTSSRNEDEQAPTYRQAGELPVSIGLADTDDGPTASPAVGRRAVPGVRRNHLRRLRSDHLPNRRVGSDDEHRLRPRHGSDDEGRHDEPSRTHLHDRTGTGVGRTPGRDGPERRAQRGRIRPFGSAGEGVATRTGQGQGRSGERRVRVPLPHRRRDGGHHPLAPTGRRIQHLLHLLRRFPPRTSEPTSGRRGQQGDPS